MAPELDIESEIPEKLLCTKTWDHPRVFPETTLEEIKENQECLPEQKQIVESAFRSGIISAKNLTTAIAKDLRDTNQAKENFHPQFHEKVKALENQIFLTIQEAIHMKGKERHKEAGPTHMLLNHMGRKNLLRKLRPEQGLALAIQCIRLQDATTFKKIIFNFKSIPDGPNKNTELLERPTSSGEYLGHLAAKTDLQEAIQYIACNHRELLDLPDKDGNTLTHTASENHSADTINYLLGLSKKLFGKKNNKGETPLDLKSGPQICRSIAIYTIDQDLKRAGETLKKALDACKVIQEKAPQKAPPPMFKILSTPKLEMETLTLPSRFPQNFPK